MNATSPVSHAPSVTGHAVQRYHAMIDSSVGREEAGQAILMSMRQPLFERELQNGCRLVGCRVSRDGGHTLGRMCLVVGPDGDVRTVGSWWRWAGYGQARP